MSLEKSNYDNFVIFFSKQFINLKKKKSFKYFQKLFHILEKRKEYAIDQELWENLYNYSIRFYKNIHNHIQEIPIFYVTKHNNILPFYMSKKIHKIPYTIVRFDTHSDLNDIKNSSLLPSLYKKYLKSGNKKYIEKAQKLVWDIGSAKSGVIMTTGPKDIVWCMPSWVPDKEEEIEYFIKQNKINLSLQTADYINDIDFTIVKKVPEIYDNSSLLKIYKKVQTGKFSKKALKSIVDMIKMNGNKYILDIDLDYFVCNGEKFDKSYFNIPYDLQSTYRTEKIDFNQHSPRYKNLLNKELIEYDQHLKKEIKKIDKRIYNFLKLIKNIKKLGYIPCLISMSDSSNVLFTECDTCNSVSNGYVPSHLALYVHMKVVKGLSNIF